MDINLRWMLLFCGITFSLITFPSTVSSDPISIDYNKCQDSTYPTANISVLQVIQCCPMKPTRPIVDGLPLLSTKEIRVKQASEGTDEAYAAKLAKAYELMRALPDDDPQLLQQQANLHCAYCGGAFITTNSSGFPQGVDIHFSWLFYPLHRYFLFFHKRILQTLLGDPTFRLNFWNWSSPWSVGDGAANDNLCKKVGNMFPALYSKSSSATYDFNRLASANGEGQLHFPDFSYIPMLRAAQQPNYNASKEDLIRSNLNVMYLNMVSGATTTKFFMGQPYPAIVEEI